MISKRTLNSSLITHPASPSLASRSGRRSFAAKETAFTPDDIYPPNGVTATPSLACRAAGRCCATTETSLTLLSFISLIILSVSSNKMISKRTLNSSLIMHPASPSLASRSGRRSFAAKETAFTPDDIYPPNGVKAMPSLACRAGGRCCATTETSLTLLSFISLIILECIFEQNDIKTHSELVPDNAPSLAFPGKSFRQAQLRC